MEAQRKRPRPVARARRSSHADAVSLIDHEMRRAEQGRRTAIRLSAAAAVGVLGIAVIVVALVFGRSAPDDAVVQAAEVVGSAAPAVSATSVASAQTQEQAEATADASPAEIEPVQQLDADESSEEPVASKPSAPKPRAVEPAPPKQATQRISIGIGYAGYEPTVAEAQAGVPIELTVEQGEGCAAGFLIPQLGVELDNSAGPATAKLGPLNPGEYRFTCAMDMVEGRLIVR